MASILMRFGLVYADTVLPWSCQGLSEGHPAVIRIHTPLPQSQSPDILLTLQQLRGLLDLQVGLQAYLMWEQAGKPDGADFSSDARNQLQQQLQSGKSVQDLENALKGPKQNGASQNGAKQTGASKNGAHQNGNGNGNGAQVDDSAVMHLTWPQTVPPSMIAPPRHDFANPFV